jgi:hypothetical protein
MDEPMRQVDLFKDHDQPELFLPPRPVSKVTPQSVRLKLVAALEQLRASDEMPWDTTNLRYWQTVFPQMTRWLPADDAAQLCGEFGEQMKRLKAG